MSHWVIVRTQFITGRHCEQSVAAAIRSMGHDAWVPMEVRFHKIDGNKPQSKHRRNRQWETPIIPTVLFAAIPTSAHGNLQAVRYFEGLQRPSPLCAPYIVTDWQLADFKEMVDRENALRLRMFTRRQQGKSGNKSIKAKGFDQLAQLLAEQFGVHQEHQEAA